MPVCQLSFIKVLKLRMLRKTAIKKFEKMSQVERDTSSSSASDRIMLLMKHVDFYKVGYMYVCMCTVCIGIAGYI